MFARNRTLLWLAMLTGTSVAGLLIVGGCALDKHGNGSVISRVGGHSDAIVEPKRCLLKVAIVSRPFGDPTINSSVWKVADEQVVPPAARRTWEVNGLRVGRISGELPVDLEAILSETAPKKRVNPTNFFVDDGEPTLLVVSQTVDQASLLLNRDNRIVGSDFKDASAYFRVTPQQEGSNDVSLRLVPEIHHGPFQRTFQAQPTASPIGPQEFTIKNGQLEETIRELATTLVLAPGQIAVIGCRPEFKRSLGSFMLTESVAHSDQRLEKLIMIWATRNLHGSGDNEKPAETTDRPTVFQRLLAPTPNPVVTRPGLPAPELPPPNSLPSPPGLPNSAGSPPTTGAGPPSNQNQTQSTKTSNNVPTDGQTSAKNSQSP